MQPTRTAGAAPKPVEGLTDLVLVRTPTGGLARPEAPTEALTAQELIEYAQSSTSPNHDLRILVDDGARNATTLGLVAEGLGCDVLVTPIGASVDRLAGPGGEDAEPVPVDRAGGAVVDWVLLQPPALATSLPGWFDLAGGLVLPRTGLATLPLAGGLEFANRDDFVVRRAAAARLGAGHPGLVTVAAATRDGAFRLSAYQKGTGGQNGRTGQDVAAALSSVYLYGGDLRLWLRWPDDAAEQRRLTMHVQALAAATGAVVWTPEPGDEAVLLRGCRDLGARSRTGEVSSWVEFRAPELPGPARFTTDRDGRLVPRSSPVVFSAGAVTMISTGRTGEDALRDRYAGARAEAGTMLVDLTIVDDGRLALRHEDGAELAAGVAELHARLEEAGWRSEDLLLLTPVAPDRAAGVRDHLTLLEDELGVEIWSLSPGAEVDVADGLPRAVDDQGRASEWLRTDGTDTGRWRNDDGWLIPRRRRVVANASVPPAPPSSVPPVPAPPAPQSERLLPPPDPRPSVTLPARAGRRHGVRWLSVDPEVTAEPVRLWLACDWPPERVATDGVPSANLFLIAHLDGERLARENPRRYLIGVRVKAGGAIDLTRLPDVPADLRHQSAYLLPAGWLDQARPEVGYGIDHEGRPGERTELPSNPIVLRCTGARHGADGLPNEVVAWPRSDRGRGAWALLPEGPMPETDHLELHQRRPDVTPGHRLVHLLVGAGRAIDVPASAAALTDLASVRSRLPELVANGMTLLLPRRAWDRSRVGQVLRTDGDKWRQVAKGIDLPLSSLMVPEQSGQPAESSPPAG
ncbi:hypothetical protein [Actinoplanes sp. NPDC089786]|uniref:hypothetical protein n=1 Tax=Actinoplanes sp. NPDC089786 TaxID=3155185 RepID=UPI00342BE37B